MKTKYWIPVISLLFLLNLLLAASCTQATIQKTTQPSSSPGTTTSSVPNVPIIAASDAYNLIQKNIGNSNFVILDVRTANEFNSGYISGAINIDYYSPEFNSDVSSLDKNKQYLVYCGTGVRSASATTIMIDLGFKEVQSLAGGITQWIQDGYPTVK